MKSYLLALIIAPCAVGCQPTPDVNGANIEGQATVNTPPQNEKASGVAPMAGGAGGMTPMSGTDSVGGDGGGGVGQAAKQMAKDKASNMGNGSLGQGEKDDSGQ
ncbi:MAG: hypothetical protein WCI55_04855 [Armatimonadota bacterium]